MYYMRASGVEFLGHRVCSSSALSWAVSKLFSQVVLPCVGFCQFAFLFLGATSPPTGVASWSTLLLGRSHIFLVSAPPPLSAEIPAGNRWHTPIRIIWGESGIKRSFQRDVGGRETPRVSGAPRLVTVGLGFHWSWRVKGEGRNGFEDQSSRSLCRWGCPTGAETFHWATQLQLLWSVRGEILVPTSYSSCMNSMG